MINFSHKSCCPDGKYAIKIAKKIRKKATTLAQNNQLEFLLDRHLGSKLIPEVNLSEIHDFPRLKYKQIGRNILYGTYQLRISKSYVVDLLKKGTAYYLTNDIINQFENKELRSDLIKKKSKIIGFKISSRHKRGEIIKKNKCSDMSEEKQFRNLYRAFIHYIPNLNDTKSILGKK